MRAGAAAVLRVFSRFPVDCLGGYGRALRRGEPGYPHGMIHAFGAFELDDGLFELRREGRVVKLPPKTFDLLLYLVRHRDRVVSKAELLDRLWEGEHVTEAVLPTNVSAARAALGDARARSGMIQTVHGRGYRFVASVEERLPASGDRSSSGRHPPALA